MKKRISILLILLLLTTGCTSEYNLTINDNSYHEEIILTSSSSSELADFNKDWQIPVDKDDYNSINVDPSTQVEIDNPYKYNLSGNNLTFYNDTTISGIASSTAISSCFNQVTIKNYQDTIIISTSSKVTCFDKYSGLTSIKVSITLDKPVKNHNADSVSGTTYTWNINKDNYQDKAINMVIMNEQTENPIKSNSSSNETVKKEKDYTLYIFCFVLIITALFTYYIIKKIKEKDHDNLDN